MLYRAPWCDVLRPFFDEMSKAQREEIRRYSGDMGLPYEFIRFSRAAE